MRRLFIYFSDSGNGDVVAEYLAGNGYDVRKVLTKKNLPKNFVAKILKGGFLAGIKNKMKLKEYDENITEYQEIAIGSPIWNGRVSCPINTVLSKTDFSGKKLSFILYSGSGTGAKAVKRLNKEYPEASIVILKEPKKYKESLELIKT